MKNTTYDQIKRPTHIVDWAFRAADRGIPQATIAHLVTLWERLEKAANGIAWAETKKDIDEAMSAIDSVKVELGIPVYASIVQRGDTQEAFDHIYFLLNGTHQQTYIIEDLPMPRIANQMPVCPYCDGPLCSCGSCQRLGTNSCTVNCDGECDTDNDVDSDSDDDLSEHIEQPEESDDYELNAFTAASIALLNGSMDWADAYSLFQTYHRLEAATLANNFGSWSDKAEARKEVIAISLKLRTHTPHIDETIDRAVMEAKSHIASRFAR